jgi:hypothetical protein
VFFDAETETIVVAEAKARVLAEWCLTLVTWQDLEFKPWLVHDIGKLGNTHAWHLLLP